MDEPFTGLDPVNLGLLREAFLELRDQGRTLVFSTHQMEAAEALCESRRDRRPRAGRGRRHARRAQAGERPSHRSPRPRRRGRAGLARRSARASSASGPGPATSSSRSTPRPSLGDPRGRVARGARVTRFEVAEPSLEAIFIEHVGRSAGGRDAGDGRTRRTERTAADARARLMTDGSAGRHDPLLPNAAIVARREYRDRVRSPLFVASTVLLMALALGVALAPIAIRYLDRHTVTRIVVVADDAGARDPGDRASTDSLLNIPPGGVDAAAWEKPFLVERATDAAAADAALASGELGGIMIVARQPERPARRHLPDRRPRRRRPQPARRVRRDRASASSTGRRRCRAAPSSAPFQTPAFAHRVDRARRPRAASRSTRRRSPAGRSSGSCSSSCCS